MGMPSNHSEPLVPLLQAHRNNTSGLANYDTLSQIDSVIHTDQSAIFDEPPPPYPNNALLVSPLSDVFPQSALLSNERLLNVGPVAQSPLAPVPLRHSSLYQVLKQESPVSPAQGTLQSGMSSIAHALEQQEPRARHAPPPCTPVLGDTSGSTTGGASESALSASQITPTSLAVVAADHRCLALPQVPALAPSTLPAQLPVSSATPPYAAVPSQNGSVATPLPAHTLAQSLVDVTTHDYDTLPRLRKVRPPPPAPSPGMPHTYTYESSLVSFSFSQRYRHLPRRTNLSH